MALSAIAKKLLNNISPGAKVAKLGDLVEDAVTPAAAVANAAAAAPTQAEFNALLISLRNAGVIATA